MSKSNKRNFAKNKNQGNRGNSTKFPARAARKPGDTTPFRGAFRPHKDPPPSTTGEGLYSGTKNGYGFVEIEGRENDIFIPASRTSGSIDGDRVSVRFHSYVKDGINRTEGEVLGIVEEGRKTVVGTLCEEVLAGRGHRRDPRYTVIADDTHLSMEITVPDIADARPGDKVEVLLKRQVGVSEITGSIVRNFGRATSREANYSAILAACQVPIDFSEEALEQAKIAATLPLTADNRTDLRNEIIFTIDGADAKDLDDAISLSVASDGSFQLGVHIANVSHYVLPKTPLDAAVMERGTSVYFIDQVVPMLPTALSNGACSLNAHEDKYALSALMQIAPNGSIGKTRVERTIIRSCVHGIYSEVNDLFENGENSKFYEKYKQAYPSLVEMHRLYLILAEKSRRRGAMELEQAEAKIILDEKGLPVDIVPHMRGDAEKMIEQFMLAANESVATLLHEKGYPCIYRVHESPQKEKLAEFAVYVHNLGFDSSFITQKDPTGCDFCHLLEEARERGIATSLSYTLLRTMAKAHYSEVCHPHFGLGIDMYCHFTSPIRRLSDLATHRMIEAVLLDGEPKARYGSYAARAAMTASETELRALTAERRIEALYKALYLSKHLGEIYPATVSSVTRFGVFAALDNTCEGLIPLTELPGGIWIFDAGNLTLRSPKGDMLHLGDRISICVEEVDIARGKVQFSLVTADKNVANGESEQETKKANNRIGSSTNSKQNSSPRPNNHQNGKKPTRPASPKSSNRS